MFAHTRLRRHGQSLVLLLATSLPSTPQRVPHKDTSASEQLLDLTEPLALHYEVIQAPPSSVLGDPQLIGVILQKWMLGYLRFNLCTNMLLL